MGNLLSLNTVRLSTLQGLTVVITGCDSGFGYETTLVLLSHGLNVVSGCFTDDGCKNLQEVANKDLAKYKGRLTTLRLDVTDDASVIAFASHVMEIVPEGIYALINNAGIADIGPCELLPLDTHKRIFEVNYFGGLRMMRSLLPSLRKFTKSTPKQTPRIVNIASVAGRVICPGLSAYSASKHAFKALTEAVRIEVKRFGVGVVVIEPAFASTGMVVGGREAQRRALQRSFESIGEEVKRAYGVGEELLEDMLEKREDVGGSLFTMKPGQVVKCIVDAVERPRPEIRYVVGMLAYILILAKNIVPTWIFDHFASKAMLSSGKNK
ncbi:hypothetical protein HDU67_007585 [Dinochytrium kinnereticum]|nr:hypothetical protein HDU67_007585 [Dinochytrium kinnereticum]